MNSNPDFRGSHDAVFDRLEPLDSWRQPDADILDKENGIIEVRLRGRVKHRILGFYDGKNTFVVVGTCYHKQDVYTPKDIKQTVVKRKIEIQQNPEKAMRCDRPK